MAERGGLIRDALDPLLERIERHDRRHRDADADRGRDQRLRDAGHHRRGRGAAGARRAELIECQDDTDDRPEQSDEGRIACERSEKAQPALDPRAV